MRFQTLIFTAILLIFLNGCRSAETPVSTTDTANTNANAATADTNNPLATNAAPKKRRPTTRRRFRRLSKPITKP